MAESFLLQSSPAPYLLSREIDLFYNGINSNVGDNSSDTSANMPLPGLNLSGTVFVQNISDIFTTNATLNSTLEENCSRSMRRGKVLNMVVEMQNMIGPPVLVFGIVTNILTLLTLQQKGMDLSPYVHLSWLAIADMSGLALILIDLYNDPFDRRWMLFRIYVYYPLSNVAAMMGVWIMVLVTLERSVVIRSIKANIRCTASRARAQVLGVFLVSAVLNGPRFFWFQVTLANEPTPTHCPPRYHICPYLQKWSGSKVLTWLYSALNTFLPLVLLITLNGFLIYSVNARRRRHPALGIAEGADTVWSSEQTRFTVTLIAIVGLFIILVMPSAFADTNILLPLLGVTHTTEVVQMFQYISNFLMWLNMSINFLLYTAINTRFKTAFKRMVWGWRRRALYWLCCWRCRDPDSKYHLRNYHYHHRHRKHHIHHRHNHMNGMKSNPSWVSNGSSSRSNRSQTNTTSLNILILSKDNNNRKFTYGGVVENKASCGRGIRAVRSYFTRKSLTRNTTSEISFPLQPSTRSSSTGTSVSSSQTPTESTEMCPMLSAVRVIPTMIEETDSLRFIPASSPDTPLTPLPSFTIEGLDHPLTSETQSCQELQELETGNEIKACEVEDKNIHAEGEGGNGLESLEVFLNTGDNTDDTIEGEVNGTVCSEICVNTRDNTDDTKDEECNGLVYSEICVSTGGNTGKTKGKEDNVFLCSEICLNTGDNEDEINEGGVNGTVCSEICLNTGDNTDDTKDEDFNGFVYSGICLNTEDNTDYAIEEGNNGIMSYEIGLNSEKKTNDAHHKTTEEGTLEKTPIGGQAITEPVSCVEESKDLGIQ
ncbi:peptide receptor GPCR [Elysia marginata]|uniref:Peptide receptor GPCR n=1 Tax=Elysia marginata TaxID=1093978 RepID=A0AAV4J585_9GAST|nr:peptide receptor GPCR [Elysia marginata]